MPDGVTELGDSLFYSCKSLSSVSIPSSVTALGTSLFHGCPSFLVVTVVEGSEADADRFCLYGHSLGGFIAFSYVAHGRYRPTAIACSCSTPSPLEMSDMPLYAATDQAVHIPTLHSQEEIRQFAQEYPPSVGRSGFRL